jgi:hypothetical protein
MPVNTRQRLKKVLIEIAADKASENLPADTRLEATRQLVELLISEIPRQYRKRTKNKTAAAKESVAAMLGLTTP